MKPHAISRSCSIACRRSRSAPVWSARAVHKPLLVLLALGRLLRLRARPAHARPRMGGNVWASKPRASSGSRRAGRTWCRTASRSRSLRHKIFDLGAFTVLPGNHQIVFSPHLHVNGRRRHQSEAARPPWRRVDSAARQGMPAACGVFGVAPEGSVQGAGAGLAGAWGDGVHTLALTAHRRRTNSAGVSIGYLSRRASRSPSPVTRISALAAASVARIGASLGSRGTPIVIAPSSTTSARM